MGWPAPAQADAASDELGVGSRIGGDQVVFADAELQLSVTNPVDTEARQRPGGGHGLIGMREHATLLAGTLHVDNNAYEFRLRARLPYPSRCR